MTIPEAQFGFLIDGEPIKTVEETVDNSTESINLLPTIDLVNHPPHYTSHPSGVECIDIIEYFPYNIAAAMKYLWRCGLKSEETYIQDLMKARWYIDRAITNAKKAVIEHGNNN